MQWKEWDLNTYSSTNNACYISEADHGTHAACIKLSPVEKR